MPNCRNSSKARLYHSYKKFPYKGRQEQSAATYRQDEAGPMCPCPTAVVFSTSFKTSATPAYVPLHASLLPAMSGPPCNGMVTCGRASAFTANALKSPGMPHHHLKHSLRSTGLFSTSTSASQDHFPRLNSTVKPHRHPSTRTLDGPWHGPSRKSPWKTSRQPSPARLLISAPLAMYIPTKNDSLSLSSSGSSN